MFSELQKLEMVNKYFNLFLYMTMYYVQGQFLNMTLMSLLQ